MTELDHHPISTDPHPPSAVSRKNLVRGGAAALLGAAALAGAAARAEAAPTPPGTRGRLVPQDDPRVNRVIDVKAWGATGDGATDDTDAVQAALDAAENGETVVFPEGRYRVTRTLTHAGTIGLLGMGQGVSRIDWDGDGDALALTFSSPRRESLVLKALTVNSLRADAGTAVSAVWSTPATQGWPHAVIEDLEITRADGAGQRWQRGLYLEAAWLTSLRGYTFLSAANTGVGLELEGQCVDCNLTDVHCQSCDTGFVLGWATEGTVIDNAVVLDGLHGVTNRVNDVGRKGPWTTIRDSHLNTRVSGVTLTGTGDCWITDCLLYKTPGSRSDWNAVELTGCRLINVRDNEIYNLSAEPAVNTGVVVTDSVEMRVESNYSINLLRGAGIRVVGSPDATITGNHNRNVDVGIELGAGSDGCIVAHNRYQVTDAGAVQDPTALTDGGADNLVTDNLDRRTG